MNIYENAQHLEKLLLAEKIKTKKQRAIIEYLSMMTDVEIPDEEEDQDAQSEI